MPEGCKFFTEVQVFVSMTLAEDTPGCKSDVTTYLKGYPSAITFRASFPTITRNMTPSPFCQITRCYSQQLPISKNMGSLRCLPILSRSWYGNRRDILSLGTGHFKTGESWIVWMTYFVKVKFRMHGYG